MVIATEIVRLVSALGTVNQRYTQLRPLSPNGGSGCFSAVFEALCTTTNQRVALKFDANRGDTYRGEAFNREGRLLNTRLKGEECFVQLIEPPAKMSVPLAVPGGSHVSFDFPFLAFEFLPNGDLTSHTSPVHGHDETIRRIELFRKACRCVRRLHHLGCFHRDLKPSNFLLDRFPFVKLGDFGTARLMTPEEKPLKSTYAAPVGDLRYTAPELLAGLDVSKGLLATADTYSLGVILYELLTGRQLVEEHLGGRGRGILGVRDFHKHMNNVPQINRKTVFHGFLDAHPSPMPDLRQINPHIPKCAIQPINRLLEALAVFDYRKREVNFGRIDRLAEIAILVVRNEQKQRERLQKKKAQRGTAHV